MAPKTIATSGRRAPAQPGMIRSLYEELRSPENAPIVKSVAIFTVCLSCLIRGGAREWEAGQAERRSENGWAGLWRKRASADTNQVAVVFLQSSWNEFLVPA
jgi:hypothetical protein